MTEEKNIFDKIGDILNRPLPGTGPDVKETGDREAPERSESDGKRSHEGADKGPSKPRNDRTTRDGEAKERHRESRERDREARHRAKEEMKARHERERDEMKHRHKQEREALKERYAEERERRP